MQRTQTEHLNTETPLDVAEHVLIQEQHPYERDEREAHFAVQGAWSDHQLWFIWREEMQTLHLHLALDLRTPKGRRGEICDLIARVNERLPIGHFDFWDAEQAIVYRSALPLIGAPATAIQISTLMAAALDAGDQFYPAFNFLIWAGKSPSEAAEAAMFDTVGEA